MIITAKYLGPTNTKGARIKVSYRQWAENKGTVKYYGWDNSINPDDNYKKAFKDYLSNVLFNNFQQSWTIDCTDDGMIATNSNNTFTI